MSCFSKLVCYEVYVTNHKQCGSGTGQGRCTGSTVGVANDQ